MSSTATATLAGTPQIAVVIPCYRVARHILDVISRVGPECTHIYVIDDGCPEHSGDIVETRCADPRVRVIRHGDNQGVGAAVITGYRAALAGGALIIAKIDGDGQMAPELLRAFVDPILAGQADYTKGNRFYDLANIQRMPATRTIGNAALSFMAKLSCGYWDLFDPTNGYTAIHANIACHLPYEKISRRYFFETDVLFRLGTIRAVVVDIPMDAQYGDESSNLRVSRVFGEFVYKHTRNTVKRIFYNYFLRDFTIASVELVVGLALFAFGATYGVVHWVGSAHDGVATPPGTVMLSALPVLMGLQLLLAFIGYDVAATPRRVIHPLLDRRVRSISVAQPRAMVAGARNSPLAEDECDRIRREQREHWQER
jgi:dolichol-phosphate mannosyltransferase